MSDAFCVTLRRVTRARVSHFCNTAMRYQALTAHVVTRLVAFAVASRVHTLGSMKHQAGNRGGCGDGFRLDSSVTRGDLLRDLVSVMDKLMDLLLAWGVAVALGWLLS